MAKHHTIASAIQSEFQNHRIPLCRDFYLLGSISILNKAQIPEALSHLSHLALADWTPFADTGLIDGVASIETITCPS